MARKIAVERFHYTFPDSAGYRDQLEQTILQEFEKAKYPRAAKIDTVKAGGWAGTKRQCVVIEALNDFSLNICCDTVGTYLYVGVYLMAAQTFLRAPGGALAWASNIGDVFEVQRITSYFNVALQITEAAFAALGLKQANYGYDPKKGDAK